MLLSDPGGVMAAESVLECRSLRRRFGEIVAVAGVGFRINPGETYGLLGPNGAGKTTSISMIAGLLERDAGEVLVVGEPMTTRSVRAKNAIGYVPQDLAIYPDLSGRENLMFFARLYGMATQEAKRRTGEVLAITGLAMRSWVCQAKTLDGSIDLVVENASSELPAILTDVAAAGAIVRSVESPSPTSRRSSCT